jgi:hypothetical protein
LPRCYYRAVRAEYFSGYIYFNGFAVLFGFLLARAHSLFQVGFQIVAAFVVEEAGVFVSNLRYWGSTDDAGGNGFEVNHAVLDLHFREVAYLESIDAGVVSEGLVPETAESHEADSKFLSRVGCF